MDFHERENMRANQSQAEGVKSIAKALDDQAAAYRERTIGLGRGVRADREATARAKAMELALKYADESTATISLGTIFTYADEIAAYILNGTHGVQDRG